jgi:cell wall-associated NlpC family hydrolase
MDRSEMITQILFGETFNILEEKGNWFLIRLHLDGYEGWIDKKQALIVTHEFIEKLKKNSNHFVTEKNAECYCKNDSTHLMLGKGCSLPLFANNTFHLGHKEFTTLTKARIFPKKFTSSKIVSTAQDYLNTPYLWGGRSIYGIDCSGFVQTVYHQCGKILPRDASQQALHGLTIDFIDEALPGDLAFFDNPSGEIIHVGILLGANKIIHASGRVKTDTIDHNGIYSSEYGTYSHSLRIIKRV